jgi:hypothetical protein
MISSIFLALSLILGGCPELVLATRRGNEVLQLNARAATLYKQLNDVSRHIHVTASLHRVRGDGGLMICVTHVLAVQKDADFQAFGAPRDPPASIGREVRVSLHAIGTHNQLYVKEPSLPAGRLAFHLLLLWTAMQSF